MSMFILFHYNWDNNIFIHYDENKINIQLSKESREYCQHDVSQNSIALKSLNKET